jgi:DNA-binding XRE family transcriptional regulator
MGLSAERKAELARKGAVETTVQEFLGIDEAGMKIVELRVRLAKEVKRRRLSANMSQGALADRLKISQPRIPAIEKGIHSSLESILMAFFATGGSLSDLAHVVSIDE